MMTKKATADADNPGVRSIQESAYLIWLAGLGAFAKISEEGGKVFETLVKKGEKIERRNRKVVASQLEVVQEQVEQTRNKPADAWDRIEQIFEDRLARVLGHFGAPSRNDVQELTQRIEALQAQVDELRRIRESRQS